MHITSTIDGIYQTEFHKEDKHFLQERRAQKGQERCQAIAPVP